MPDRLAVELVIEIAWNTHLAPESQELVEGMLNTAARGAVRENVDLAPRKYTLGALTLRAGSDTWDGLRVAGPPPPWVKARSSSALSCRDAEPTTCTPFS